MTQIRPHVSDYSQSMADAVNIECVDDLFAYVRCHLAEKCVQPGELAQRHFGADHRNGWDSWLITLRASPILWADSPVPDLPVAVVDD